MSNLLNRILADIDEAVLALEPEERAAVVTALASKAAALSVALVGLPPRRWANEDRAVEVAGVPAEQLRRWARRSDVSWASWPTKRTLLVDLEALDRWITGKRFARGRQRHEAAPARPKTRIRAEDDDTNTDAADRTSAGRR